MINEDRNYDTFGNDLIIMHESKNKIKSIVVGDMKKIEDELKNKLTEFKYIFNFNEKTLVMMDTNNKFYSSGEWFGNYDNSEDFDLDNRPELDKINSEEKIVYIGNNVVLTKTSLYFFKGNIPSNIPSSEILFDGKVSKFPLPELKDGEVFIKASYTSSVILLTNKMNLYGLYSSYRRSCNIINSSEKLEEFVLTQIKVPESLNIIDFVANNYNLIYLGYDTKKKTNLVYGNLNLDRMHFFTKTAERNLTHSLYMKEISFLSDKNITNIYLTEDKFVAFSQSEGKVYYLDENQYGVRSLKYFLNLNIRVKNIINRENCFLFVIDDKKNIINEEDINKKEELTDNKKNDKTESNDNYIYFYRCEQNYDIGNKIFYSGTIDISKLVGEKDSVDNIKLKKPKMINVGEDYIKQNYLKKKTDLTLKIKDVLYNGSNLFLYYDYYQSFINPKKIIEESSYSLKEEKITFNVILKESKGKLYSIDLISKYDKTDKDDEYEQFLFQIDSKEINSLPEKDQEKYNKIIEENLKDDKCKFIYIFDLDENGINLEQLEDKKLIYIQILKEEIFQFIEYFPQIKKIVFDLPKKIVIDEDTEDTYLIDNLQKVKELYKNRLVVENNLNFSNYFIEKINDDLLEIKMEIANEKIEQFFPEEHKKIKQKVINLLSSIDDNYLLEYQKIYPIYLKEMEEIRIKLKKNQQEKIEKSEENQELKEKTLKEYMKEKYQFYDRYIKFYEQPELIDTVSNIVSEISKSAENLLSHGALLYNTSLTKTLFDNISFLSEKSRLKNFESNLLLLQNSKFMREIRINRLLNLKMCNKNLIDKDLEWSLIAQLYKSPLGKEKGSSFFKGRAKNLFQVNLEGEHASDMGGPGREIFTSSIEQLTSSNVDLFIPSPNNKSQTGLDRDKYIFNPLGAKNEKYLELYKFIGKLFGYIISSETFATINLSSVVYKQILGMQLEASDIELIDIQSYKSIIRVLTSHNMEQKRALFGLLTFTCQLPGGEIVELKEKGKEIYVDENNYDEFLELYLKTMTNQGYLQAKALQEGLYEVIPEYMLKFLTPLDLEKKICGEQEFDLDLLKSMTKYDGYSPTDLTIKHLWKFLEECSLEDKLNYIKFTWGRSRLPKDQKGFGKEKHEIVRVSPNGTGNNSSLPTSHTCFFQIDLPQYDNYAVLKNKLLYAIRNSVIISEGFDRLDFEI